MWMTRRYWLSTATAGACAVLAPRRLLAGLDSAQAELEQRIGRLIGEYSEQGFHRTGTAVDRESGEWLCEEIRRIGLVPARESFDLTRIDPINPGLVVQSRRITGVPLFDGIFDC